MNRKRKTFTHSINKTSQNIFSHEIFCTKTKLKANRKTERKTFSPPLRCFSFLFFFLLMLRHEHELCNVGRNCFFFSIAKALAVNFVQWQRCNSLTKKKAKKISRKPKAFNNKIHFRSFGNCSQERKARIHFNWNTGEKKYEKRSGFWLHLLLCNNIDRTRDN